MKMDKDADFREEYARIFTLQNGLPLQYIDNIERALIDSPIPYIRRDTRIKVIDDTPTICPEGMEADYVIPTFVIISNTDKRAVRTVKDLDYAIKEGDNVLGYIHAMLVRPTDRAVIWTSKFGTNNPFHSDGSVAWEQDVPTE